MKNICVIGTGYVGLVNGTCFADLGNNVVTVDIDERKVQDLKNGIMPIYEPGLKDMVERNVKAGRLHFTTSYEDGLKNAEYVFICVGTPSGVDGEADLKYVRTAAETIAKTMDHPLIVINKSTVPVGTGDWVSDIIQKNLPEPIDFAVVSCPEFLREGSAVVDFMQTDRTVLGSTNRAAAQAVAQLYLPLRAPIMMTDLRTAEMIKYASNAFLATRLSFINEISIICEKLGADVIEVAQGMGFDKRIGHHFLQPGVGYGGSCFLGDETIYTVEGENIVSRTLESLFDQWGEPYQGDVVEVVMPRNQFVLGFDLDAATPSVTEVYAFTRRPYNGTMVTLTMADRSIVMTADHPVVIDDADGFRIISAIDVREGDLLLALTEMPQAEVMLAFAMGDDADVVVQQLPGYKTVSVKKVEHHEMNVMVYSLETGTGTFIGDANYVLHNCFPKDVKALAHMAQTHGMHPQLLHAVMEINDFQRKHVVLKLHEVLGDLKGKVIGILGLAFKENTDDIRESPALAIASHLLEQGAIVRGYDPVAMENSAALYPQIGMCSNSYEVAEGADALVIATPWNEFKQLDMRRICESMAQAVMIDGRNMYDPAKMKEIGFAYRGVGRGYDGHGLDLMY